MVVTAASAVEMLLMTGQVIRGRQSHFNQGTPFDERLYNAMAVTVVVLWTATLVIAVLLFRTRGADRATTWAIRTATVLALAGAGIGFAMTRPTEAQLAVDDAPVVGAHSVGVPDGGPAMPLTGWSTTGGDLRVPHFFGMHALQLLPLLVLALTLLAARFALLRRERVRLHLVLVAAWGLRRDVRAGDLAGAARPVAHPPGRGDARRGRADPGRGRARRPRRPARRPAGPPQWKRVMATLVARL